MTVTIQGNVMDTAGNAIAGAELIFFSRETGETTIVRSRPDGGYEAVVGAGAHIRVAIEEGYKTEKVEIAGNGDNGVVDHPVVLERAANGNGNGVSASGVPASTPVADFLSKLGEPTFSLEAPISEEEAEQAVGLFSVVNMMLAGLSQYEDKTDMLGILRLYYGLQRESLTQITVTDPSGLWLSIESELQTQAEKLDQLQSDVDFLGQEAKRQFNLGTRNNVQANAEFPALFQRYVALGTDPLLSVDTKREEDNQFFDKVKLQQTYDLMRDLKAVILQIVRSLSKYGTMGTRRVNNDWAAFESSSLDILAKVAKQRVSKDLDNKTPWAVLADVTGRNLSDIQPYIALAVHGTALLETALDVYKQTKGKLDAFEPEHLRDLFQAGNESKGWFTTRIRAHANVVRRYPLANWT